MAQKAATAHARRLEIPIPTKRRARVTAAPELVIKNGRQGPTLNFRRAYQIGRIELIDLAKEGLPARTAVDLARQMSITMDRLFKTIGLARATIDRKVRENKTLSPEESARVLGVARLVGLAQSMVEESGNPDGFNAAKWVAGWLEQPIPALAGRRPAELMDTAEGQSLVVNLLERAQSGAYA